MPHADPIWIRIHSVGFCNILLLFMQGVDVPVVGEKRPRPGTRVRLSKLKGGKQQTEKEQEEDKEGGEREQEEEEKGEEEQQPEEAVVVAEEKKVRLLDVLFRCRQCSCLPLALSVHLHLSYSKGLFSCLPLPS